MQDFEKLGLFYIGKKVDPTSGKLEDDFFLLESKNLTTHAVCLGMTGSGKTGLGIVLLEEAALDKIPAIIIDPKGDLGNLLLTFPDLSPNEFRPWIDEAEAERKGMSADAYSEYISKTWKEGLASWGESADRIKRLRNTVDLAVYTPASDAGIPISILRSFAAPPKEQLADAAAIRDKILSLTASLLGLLDIDADPIKSREHILISSIIQQAWQSGKNLDIASLIQQVQKPPFAKIGALDIETFYPQKDRMALSISINSFLASPGFQAWMQGVPLDIDGLLYSSTGKPKLSVISIAHLSDPERMFFVTLLLNEVVSWMRRQSGTSSLRTLLYMDEIFGFFPPTAMPPSKLPMLTLLKQARAFGLGVVLATQNPVDLDYKGLANCGTWFIGKLQTDRDRARVIEGIKIASTGEIETKSLDKDLAMTGNRIFLMRSVYEKKPILFQTRWTMSYLRGPLTLPQISILTDRTKESFQVMPTEATKQESVARSSSKPNVPPGITEYFVNPNGSQRPVHYEPKIAGIAKLHFVDAKSKTDTWIDVCFALPADDDGKSVHWENGTNIPGLKNQLQKNPIPSSTFGELPPGLMQEKNYAQFAKDFVAALYQNQSLTIYQTTNPNMISKPEESEREFRVRVTQELREKRDELVHKLREKYAGKIATLQEKLKRAQERLSQKQEKAGLSKIQTMISFGAALLGALLGRGVTKGTITQTGTSLRRATQIGKESHDATIAEGDVSSYQQQLQDLQTQMDSELSAIAISDVNNISVDTTLVRPRKSDITVEKIALVWWGK